MPQDAPYSHNNLLSKPVICVVGPTASGKSSLAQRIALALGGEVVSADSMQIYRGMDIGTGKVTPRNRLVPHYGLDIAEPGEPFSAALFQEYARACFNDVDQRNARVILCGGTGFYVRAAIDDYRFPKGEQENNPVREKYLAIANESGAHALWELLRERDSESADIIPENDVKRVVRAFELLEEGTTYAQQKEKLAHIAPLYDSVWIGLNVNPALLRKRIDERVDNMVEDGLVEEVQKLLGRGLKQALTANQAIGYKEIVSALEGTITLEEAIEQIKTATHRYAKRQRTWFRKDKRVVWLNADDADEDRLLRESLAIIEAFSNNQKRAQDEAGTYAQDSITTLWQDGDQGEQ